MTGNGSKCTFIFLTVLSFLFLLHNNSSNSYDRPALAALAEDCLCRVETKALDSYNLTVFPRIKGGLGNQMFVMAAALIVASETGRSVTVNGKQTASHSSGTPQPVFWHTVFHSPIFVKEEAYSEAGSEIMGEGDFDQALLDDFQSWKNNRSILLTGSFLRFDVNKRYRRLLLQAFQPTSEVQRWVNDAAIMLGLTLPSNDMPTSLPLSQNKENAADFGLSNTQQVKLETIKPLQEFTSWCTNDNPKECEKQTVRVACEAMTCEDNIALHIRLRDGSSIADYWSEQELISAKEFLRAAVQERKTRRIVIFSNDLKRAEKLFESEEKYLLDRIAFSNHLDVVEFYLMSQYFGTHVLTPLGSSFQMWALFLSPLENVRVFAPTENVANINDLRSMEHIEFESIHGS